MATMRPFLMFSGNAESTINFYTSVFEDCKILSIERFGNTEGAANNKIKQAVLLLNGLEIVFMDSTINHDFTFTPAISFQITFETEEKLTSVFERLTADGQILMPLSRYPFASKFAWVNDKFGISWQFNLK